MSREAIVNGLLLSFAMAFPFLVWGLTGSMLLVWLELAGFLWLAFDVFIHGEGR